MSDAADQASQEPLLTQPAACQPGEQGPSQGPAEPHNHSQAGGSLPQPECPTKALGLTDSDKVCCKAKHHTSPVILDLNPDRVHEHLSSCFGTSDLSQRAVGAALRQLVFSLITCLDNGKAALCRKCKQPLSGGEANISKHIRACMSYSPKTSFLKEYMQAIFGVQNIGYGQVLDLSTCPETAEAVSSGRIKTEVFLPCTADGCLSGFSVDNIDSLTEHIRRRHPKLVSGRTCREIAAQIPPSQGLCFGPNKFVRLINGALPGFQVQATFAVDASLQPKPIAAQAKEKESDAPLGINLPTMTPPRAPLPNGKMGVSGVNQILAIHAYRLRHI